MNDNNITNSERDEFRIATHIPPSPPTVAKTRPNYRTGWSSAERILSGSMRLSRASTRTSLASDDLEKYMNGSLNNMSLTNDDLIKATLGGTNSINSIFNKPLPPPRISSSGSANNVRILSGRNQDIIGTVSAEGQSHSIPPPVKVENRIQ